jgi:hypothetical protein
MDHYKNTKLYKYYEKITVKVLVCVLLLAIVIYWLFPTIELLYDTISDVIYFIKLRYI